MDKKIAEREKVKEVIIQGINLFSKHNNQLHQN
jgi:hypothetical protein